MDGLVGEFWMDFTIQNHQILTTDGSVFQELLVTRLIMIHIRIWLVCRDAVLGHLVLVV